MDHLNTGIWSHTSATVSHEGGLWPCEGGSKMSTNWTKYVVDYMVMLCVTLIICFLLFCNFSYIAIYYKDQILFSFAVTSTEGLQQHVLQPLELLNHTHGNFLLEYGTINLSCNSDSDKILCESFSMLTSLLLLKKWETCTFDLW